MRASTVFAPVQTGDLCVTFWFLKNLLYQARLTDVELSVINEDFDTLLSEAPQADLDIFGLGQRSTIQFMNETADQTESACLFVMDSGRENILA